MKLLLDTHVLIWAAQANQGPDSLSREAVALIGDEANELHFSAVSLWEVVIKSGLGRKDFQVDPHLLRRGLLDNGYREVAISSEHCLAVAGLPPIHKDPFDRLLVAQAQVEGATLLTSDAQVAQYDGPIRKV